MHFIFEKKKKALTGLLKGNWYTRDIKGYKSLSKHASKPHQILHEKNLYKVFIFIIPDLFYYITCILYYYNITAFCVVFCRKYKF